MLLTPDRVVSKLFLLGGCVTCPSITFSLNKCVNVASSDVVGHVWVGVYQCESPLEDTLHGVQLAEVLALVIPKSNPMDRVQPFPGKLTSILHLRTWATSSFGLFLYFPGPQFSKCTLVG